MKEFTESLNAHIKEYRPIPFWSWNDDLEPEELKRQIQWMHENGIGGFFMHARGGLKTSYLSEEWMECIRVCCDEAKRLQMEAWIYDENGWPSGFVGGKLLKKEENRDMYIQHTIGKFDAEADVSYRLDGERLVRTVSGEVDCEYLNLYLHRSTSTVDILNPKVVDQFINETHEKYKAYFGEAFSSMAKGFFTDEPQYYRWGTAYTVMVKAYFEEQYGEDIFDSLGLLFVEKQGYRAFRYKYWLAMQKLMLENFAKKLYEWCDSNDMQLTGHYVEERSLGGQVLCCGGVMPFYKYEHIPGIDWLGIHIDSGLSVRQLGSVATQFGKKKVMTESFGCCGWDVTPSELKKLVGFQYVNGVNLVCNHLMAYSERGQRKYDHPVHFNKLNPWVKEQFADFNQYISALGTLGAESEEYVDVAILHPIRSAYFDYKRDGYEFGVIEFEHKIQRTLEQFSARGIAYHFLDETLLEDHGFVEGSSIGCGKCKYTYLVIPEGLLTMGRHTEQLVKTFVEHGGKVLIMTEKPTYLEGEPYAYAYLESNCTLEEISQAQPFQVESPNTELYYTYRTMGEKSCLIVQNISNEHSITQTIQLKDQSNAFEWLDLMSMETKQCSLTVTLHENDTAVLFPVKVEVPKETKLEEYDFTFKNAELSFENNYFTVDAVRYSKNGTTYSEPILVHRLFKQLLEERYEGKLWLKYDFQVQTIPKSIALFSENCDARSQSINGIEFRFKGRDEDESSLYTADITSMVRIGKNSYETVLDWHQSEETYYALFGENVTESLKNCVVYDSEIEAIYLSGTFGVYSRESLERVDEETVCGHSFYIGKVPEKVSEPVLEGLPFMRGAFTLHQKVEFSHKNILLHLAGRYLTAKIWVNERFAGELLFGKKMDISDYVVEGMNDVKVEFTVGNRNLFGPFHSTQEEAYVGPDMFTECTLSDAGNGVPRYKLKCFYKEER